MCALSSMQGTGLTPQRFSVHSARLRQRLHGVLSIHVAEHDAQAVGALQLPNAPVQVLWLQQVEPGGHIQEAWEGTL